MPKVMVFISDIYFKLFPIVFLASFLTAQNQIKIFLPVDSLVWLISLT